MDKSERNVVRSTTEPRGSFSLDLAILTDQVSEVVTEIAGKKISDWDANLRALGMDSMALLDVLATLEERFGIFLNENTVLEFYSINRITNVVQEAIRSS